MGDVPGLYLLAAVVTESWTSSSVAFAFGKASVNISDTRTMSIASWRRTRIAGCCKHKFTFFFWVTTKSVSGGHVLEVAATPALTGTLLCWCDVSSLTAPGVCTPMEAEWEVIAELFQDGLYKVIISWGCKEWSWTHFKSQRLVKLRWLSLSEIKHLPVIVPFGFGFRFSFSIAFILNFRVRIWWCRNSDKILVVVGDGGMLRVESICWNFSKSATKRNMICKHVADFVATDWVAYCSP